MAGARQRAEWEREAILTANVINRNGWTRQPVDPVKLIPPMFRPETPPAPELTPEQEEEQSRMAWAVLDRAFGGR